MNGTTKHPRIDWGLSSDFELLAIEASIQPYRMALALERALKLPVALAEPFLIALSSRPSDQPLVLTIPAFGATLNTALSPNAPESITGKPGESLHIRYLVILPEDEQSGELMLLTNQGSRQLLFPKLRTTAFLLKIADVSKEYATQAVKEALENQKGIESVKELSQDAIAELKHLDAFYLD